MKNPITVFATIIIYLLILGLSLPQKVFAQGTFRCRYKTPPLGNNTCVYDRETCNPNAFPNTALCATFNGNSAGCNTPKACSVSGGGPVSPVFGTVNSPPGVSLYGGGISDFISNIVKLLIVVAGIWSFFNFVMAGYSYLSAGDDPKKIESAGAKIWQTVLGLTVAAGAFILAGIFGKLIFNDYNALLQLKIFGPI